jgi:hypothetical protein
MTTSRNKTSIIIPQFPPFRSLGIPFFKNLIEICKPFFLKISEGLPKKNCED